MLNHPGEQGKLIVKVKEGQSMTLLSQEGRWLKVRVQGRTGWVPRSKVEMSDPDEIARNTRRRPFVDGRSTKRGFGSSGAPDDRIGADAVGGGGDDSASEDDKPAKHTTTKDDDEDDKPTKTAKKPDTKKPDTKKPTSKDDDDEDDDKPTKTAKKPDTKKPDVKKPDTKKPTSKDDDDEDDDKPTKTAAKKPDVKKPDVKKPAGKDDDEGDDEENPIPGGKKPVAKTEAKKPAGKDDDDEGSDEPAEEAKEKRAVAHVGAKSKVFAERDESSDVEFEPKPADTLYPGETKGNWTHVESDDGDEGWILTDKLDIEGGSSGGGHGRQIGISVGLGAGFISQSMTTAGSTKTGADQVPDNYSIGATSETLALGGSFYTGLGAKYLVGIDASYAYSKTFGSGIQYMGKVSAITLSDFFLRGSIGYPTSRPSGLTLLARLGVRYRGYLVDGYNTMDPNNTNTAKVPQETLFAPTLGIGIVMPKLTSKLGLQIGLDAILFGASVTQTNGLQDGPTASMSGENVNIGLLYSMNEKTRLIFAYDLDHASYDFGDASKETVSTRGHTGMDVTRGDNIHMFSITYAKGF
ncbi:MAG: SH3 domain-containing protein [Kofleriaceae bacterium]